MDRGLIFTNQISNLQALNQQEDHQHQNSIRLINKNFNCLKNKQKMKIISMMEYFHLLLFHNILKKLMRTN